jgi:hypothetical protein
VTLKKSVLKDVFLLQTLQFKVFDVIQISTIYLVSCIDIRVLIFDLLDNNINYILRPHLTA